MKTTVIMSDADYQRIVAAGGKRVKGSMGLINPSEFDFHAFAPELPTDNTPRQVLRTKHGKTVIQPDRVRLVVLVRRGDGEPSPTDTIYDEADASAEFIMSNI